MYFVWLIVCSFWDIASDWKKTSFVVQILNNLISSCVCKFKMKIDLLESYVIPVYVDVKNIDIFFKLLLSNYTLKLHLWRCGFVSSFSIVLNYPLWNPLVLFFIILACLVLFFLTSAMILTPFLRLNNLFAILFSIKSRKQYTDITTCLENLKLTNRKTYKNLAIALRK